MVISLASAMLTVTPISSSSSAVFKGSLQQSLSTIVTAKKQLIGAKTVWKHLLSGLSSRISELKSQHSCWIARLDLFDNNDDVAFSQAALLFLRMLDKH